eukprot:Skav217138  [mRNA]  locus=scaffold1539:138801:148567:- [translate_table: standard]
MNFAWPLGRRLCRPLGHHFVRHGRNAAALALAAGASAMMLAHPGRVKADDDGLTNEERRTVELFKQCSGSVVHINTFVLNVEPGSPAELAGLQPTLQSHQGIVIGDEILSVDGKAWLVVKSSDDILALVDEKAIGETVEITFLRRQRRVEKLTAKLTLRERPQRTHVSTARREDPPGIAVTRPSKL